MESINIADRDMLFWAGSSNRFNDSNSNDFIVNEYVIVKYIYLEKIKIIFKFDC